MFDAIAVQSLPEAHIKTLVGYSEAMDTQLYTHNIIPNSRLPSLRGLFLLLF